MESNKVSNCNSKNRFADYFVICGLDYSSGLEPDTFAGDNLHSSPLERPYKCKVLGHYPENVTWNPFDKDAVGMLCLPHGLQFRTQKHPLDPRFHSFVITRQDGKRYYGASYVFFEEVRNRKISTAMQTLQAMHLTELSSGQQPSRKHVLDHNTRSLPRHFKLASHHTRIAQNYYDHTKDTLHVTKSIALILQLPFIHAAEAFLIGLYRCWKEQGPVSLESYIYNLVYEVVVPGPGRSLSFLCYPDCVTVIQRPSNIEELPLFDYSMREMFTLLGVDCVLQLFTCVLLENQVLLCSSEYQRLMLVAECMTALLFPFTWPHVYVPILPSSLQHFLDAPVPFIMGLHSRENRINIPSEANLCYIDLDSRTVQLPEELPSFPHKSEFICEISEILDRYKVPSNHDRIINTQTDMSENSLMTTSCTLPRKHSWANELDDTSRPPLLSCPDTLKRLVKLARRTGVSLDGIDGPDWDINLNDSLQDSDEELDENQVIDEESYERELRFNNSIREIFLNRFVHIFASYEHFVIQPNQDKEQWLSNRESMQNFDKATFLSDQPQHHLPFLSRFIETQMFATLVDNKILATWSKTEPNLRVFERRIKLLRKRYGGGDVVRSPCYERCSSINDSQRLLDKRLASVDVQVAPPREMLTNHASRNTRAGFPLLDNVLLNQEPSLRSRKRSSSVQWRAPRSGLTHSLSSVSLDELDAPAPRRTPSEAHPLGANTLKPTPNKPPPAMSPALIAQTNWNFVEKLLKDCKAKTKRMLVEKMGTEAVQLGHSTQTSLVEENTLIASLCDLLERIWAHGLHNKQGKSALWSHLLNYQELEECNDTSKPIDPNFLTPDLSSMALETSPASSPTVGRSRSETRTSNTRRLSEESHAQPSLRPLPSSLTFDMRCVQAMTDIKTHIGYARAWVRLSLEKKLLSRHLRTLLSDTALLKSQYKRYAFLRCDEEKEQFLYHLLTLNAVDYHCFTNTYTNTRIPYRVAIFSSQKTNAGTTTANCWLVVSGSLGETQRVPVPRGSFEFVFHHKNLGILTTLRIAHDNTGLSPKWMVEYVIVRNEITGHTYSFPCGRWLGRGIDDDSTERLLVGERVSEHSERGRGSNSPRVRSPSVPPPKRAMPVADIQTMLGDCLNSIVKFYHHPGSQDQVSSWTLLLCGETGLVACLEQVFLFGFKSVRLFGRNLYIWDFIAKVKEEKESAGECDDVTRYYCDLVDKILMAGHSLGKDGRFQLFVCLGARDGMLADVLLSVMAASRCALDMYEDQSFLRDPSLLLYIGQILESLNQFDIVLENSLTQGIS
ncbi:DENN domain-containing protein 5B isoform X4 [Macrosteles quadrilineatus]|uniref:DENN domain-containing protein 5B isoform X4 n=1 Tax=Macrosteles quadrilineatus TaxID=74068 RepID=UPI0023E232C6|nr:DENN domain-containing protein 5B isoform X4 [Macrosteles quadrilineatus]